jgi:hypothetical protein
VRRDPRARHLNVFILCPYTRTSSGPDELRVKTYLLIYSSSIVVPSFVRPGTNPWCHRVHLYCFLGFLSSSRAHVLVRPFTRCHLCWHCFFVRPGTSAVITPQFFSPCVCTASFSLLSSSSVHEPVRAIARSMLESKI